MSVLEFWESLARTAGGHYVIATDPHSEFTATDRDVKPTMPRSRSFLKRSRKIYREEAFILDVVGILLTLIVAVRYMPIGWLINFEWFSGNQVVRFTLAIGLIVLAVLNFRRSRRKIGTFLLLPVVVLIVEVAVYIPFSRETGEVLPYRKLRVVTFNSATSDPDDLINRVSSDGADVVCLQELYVRYLDEIEEQAAEAGYSSHFVTLRDDAGMGTMILTRYPTIAVDTITTSSWKEVQRRFLSVHIDVQGRIVRIITAQLESTNRKQQLWGVIESWRLRTIQANLIAETIEGSRGSVVLAGDMNASPTNRSLMPLREQLEDSWQVAGAGVGGTWPRFLPLLRIDYIFYKGISGAVNTARYPLGNSDHIAYRVDLILPEE